jgi:Ca2+-binding RTX toxin-like protein
MRNLQNLGTCSIEGLETRTLFSVIGYAISDGGQLLVTGSNSADQISVHLVRTTEGGPVNVELMSGLRVTKPVVVKNVTGISVSGRNGNDRIFVFGNLDERYSDTQQFYISVNAGGGHDNVTVKNFDGVLGVSAGDGDDNVNLSNAMPEDYVRGPQSYRWVYGGTGNDVIQGSFDNDDLDGEDGDDVLVGSAGDDYLTGGRGTNLLMGGDGDDTALIYPENGLYDDNPYPWHYGGKDHFDGGDGEDRLMIYTNTGLSTPRVFSVTTINVELKDVYDYDSDGGGKG